VGHVTCEGENRNARKAFAGKPERKRALWKTQASMRRLYYNGSQKKWDGMERVGSHGSG